MSIKTLLTALATTGFIAAGSADAATIALFDFEQYANTPTGETAVTSGTDPRLYEKNNALPTGVTSVSPITLIAGGEASGQNQVEESARLTGTVNVTSKRYRWRMTTAGTTSASFSVELAPGYTLDDFAISLVQTGNATGTFDVTYNAGAGDIAMGSGTIDSDDNFDGDNDNFTSNTIATAVSGTINFKITVNNTTANRTARWDDFTLTGDVLVPEPGSLALLGLGGLLIGARRRRA